MSRLCRFAFLACSLPVAAAAAPPDATALSQARTAIAQLPLRFEANQGQMASPVRFTARAGGYTLHLTERGPSLAFPDSRRVDIALLHSNRAPVIEPVERLAARTDYFLGSNRNWHTDVPSYSRVRYRAVYPGIDVVYYGKRSQLEYDFVLQPGADPNAIRMQFRGAGRVKLSPKGDLVLQAAGAQLVQKKPVIYQEEASTGRRQEIRGRYILIGRNTVGVRLDAYDTTRRLVIDPVFSYVTYMGGTQTDQINAVKLGRNNRLYIAGQTDNADLPYIDGAYNNNTSGLTDIFIAIVDTTPGAGYRLVYFSYLGGANLDIPKGIDVDAKGVVYLTGTTNSTNFPVTGGAFQATGAANFIDAFVVKLDPAGYGGDALIYSSYLGGAAGDDTGNGIAVGSDGMMYVIGTTKSTDFPLTASAYQSVLWNAQDTFLCKIDPNAGALVYSTYLGGEAPDDGRAILVDAKNLVYFASSTLSQNFPVAGFAARVDPAGAQDVVVGVMDMTKAGQPSLVYSTYYGGSGNEEVRGMAFDSNGNLVFTGYTLSTDLTITGDALQATASGGGDAFVAILNPSGAFQPGLLYSTYLGGSGGDVGYAVGADVAGNIYVTGYTLSSDFPIAGSAPQAGWGGGTNVFITKFKPGVGGRAAISMSTYLGATGTSVPSSLAIGADGTMYVAGRSGLGLPSSASAQQGGYAGGVSDGFLVVIAQ
jgi:hypothetical protein